MALIVSSPVFIDRKYLIVFVVDMQVVLTKSSMWRILSHRVWASQRFPSMSSFFHPVLIYNAGRIEVNCVFFDG